MRPAIPAVGPKPVTEAAVNAIDEASSNGQIYVIRNTGGEIHVAIRDDEMAKEWDAHPSDRWFSALSSSAFGALKENDPLSLWQYCRYATAVWGIGEVVLGEAPNAVGDN